MNNSLLRTRLHLLAVVIVVMISWSTVGAETTTGTPLPQAHSHNDYLHARPLLDALDQGFCSVEADIWLVGEKLLVAHDLREVKPERTLEALYLDPLAARVKRNGGRVHADGPQFTLMIDVKSDATNTYRALAVVLERYASMLTRFRGDRAESNAVTIIISGNRAREQMRAEASRLAAYDGRLADLHSMASPHFIPLVSDNWTQHFKWRARPEDGAFPELERKKLRELVDKAHAQGRRLRLWATPDQPAMWKELREAGVDLINTDKLEELSRFLRTPAVR
jgi:glycerophosphoryl diester phosphodiesterase